jgi:tellurite resistance protein TerC
MLTTLLTSTLPVATEVLEAQRHLGEEYKVFAYAGFIGIILTILLLDLGVFHRKAHEVTAREAIRWTIVWVSCALLFNVAVYFLYEHHVFGLGLEVPVLGSPGTTMTVRGFEAAKLYITGYLIEESLSMDNVFVIAVILGSLGIPAKYQHRVLFWGIMGAVVMRGLMIFVGVTLIEHFAWISYVFGAVLIITAVRMAFMGEDEQADPSKSTIFRLIKRFIPVTTKFDGQRFFTRMEGVLHATPLLVALVMVEFTDLIFAVDSIPAIFAITADPFIVFTSNIFAILGLRSLYFCLAAMIRHFRYVKPALVLVLLFIGIKMCLVHTPYKIDTDISVGVVLGMLATGVVASLLLPAKEEKEEHAPAAPAPAPDAGEAGQDAERPDPHAATHDR